MFTHLFTYLFIYLYLYIYINTLMHIYVSVSICRCLCMCPSIFISRRNSQNTKLLFIFKSPSSFTSFFNFLLYLRGWNVLLIKKTFHPLQHNRKLKKRSKTARRFKKNKKQFRIVGISSGNKY